MRGKITTGIWFIFFGIVALLHNFDVINFNFWAILKYWPLLIIAIGTNLIFQNKPNGGIVMAAINVCLCVFLGYVGLTSERSFTWNVNRTYEYTNDTTDARALVSEAMSAATKEATLEFNLGAVALKLDDKPTNELISATTSSDFIGLKLEKDGDEEHPKLDLTSVVKNNNGKQNRVHFSLNPQPTWNLIFNMGAVSFNGDFSTYDIAKIEINAGAASFDLKLPAPKHNEVPIEINTAASSCKIALPKDAAVRIEMDSFLSSKKLDGFNKKDKYQQTENFDSAPQKYIIKIAGAANSLKIDRY